MTGAASGLGLAMAEVMADGGARVTLVDLDADGLEQAAGRLDGDVAPASSTSPTPTP